MDEKKLEELFRMVQENNRMLHSARRSAFIGGIFKFVFWVLILVVLPYIAWLYLEPYFNTIMAQYQTLQSQSGALSSQASALQEQLNQFGSFQDLLSKFGVGGN